MTSDAAVSTLSPLVWLAEFETGCPSIDDEHRQLLVDINALSDLLVQGAGWLQVLDKSRQLRDKCFEHFDEEEEILENASYDKLAAHKKEHLIVRRQLDDILGRLGKVAVLSLVEFEAVLLLRSILVNHFFRYDILFKAHLLRQRGKN
jgi:hemerythrin-like metal-binding protein